MDQSLIEEAMETFGEYLRAAAEAEELHGRFIECETRMTPEERTEYSQRLRASGEALNAQAAALETEAKERFHLHTVK